MAAGRVGDSPKEPSKGVGPIPVGLVPEGQMRENPIQVGRILECPMVMSLVVRTREAAMMAIQGARIPVEVQSPALEPVLVDTMPRMESRRLPDSDTREEKIRRGPGEQRALEGRRGPWGLPENQAARRTRPQECRTNFGHQRDRLRRGGV
jgi:hypothetical protein